MKSKRKEYILGKRWYELWWNIMSLKINNSTFGQEYSWMLLPWQQMGAVESVCYRPCSRISARENYSQTRRTVILWLPLTNKRLNSTCQSGWPRFGWFISTCISLNSIRYDFLPKGVNTAEVTRIYTMQYEQEGERYFVHERLSGKLQLNLDIFRLIIREKYY